MIHITRCCTVIAWIVLLAAIPAAADTQQNKTTDRLHRAYSLAHRKSCGQLALQLGVPQVALLFLTTADLVLNDAWRVWLSTVNGKLPALSITASCMATNTTHPPHQQRTVPNAFGEQHATSQLGPFHTNQLLLDELATSCRALTNDPATPALFRQQLYTIYSHTPPDFQEYAPGSLLFGRRITQRIPSVRISHTLVTVERFLLREALQWSLNSRFVFLSESHLPLYPAAMVYMQVVHEPRARIDACPPLANRDEDSISYWRWKPELSPKELWRKTSHWITMTRQVASVVVHERQVDAAFEQHCLSHCSNIEHYIPTMLAVHNLVHLTSCARGSTYVDWSVKNEEGRPRTFYAEEVNQGMMQYARTVNCEPPGDLWATVYSAQRGLVDVDLLQEGVCEAAATAPEYAPLEVSCALFVRKVDKNASAVAATLMEELKDEMAYRVDGVNPPPSRGGGKGQVTKNSSDQTNKTATATEAKSTSQPNKQEQGAQAQYKEHAAETASAESQQPAPSAQDMAAAAAAAAVASSADDEQIPQ